VNDARIFPWLEIPRAELERLVEGPIASVEPVMGGYTNTLHRVALASGQVVTVKHYAAGATAFADELATLTRLAGILPVPEVVRADPGLCAIVYRWIDGSTLEDCRRRERPAALASLADPLGRLFAWLARTPPLVAGDRWDVAPLVTTARAQLAAGRARDRMGDPLADALTAVIDRAGDRLAWGTPCLSHGDIGGRNILVQRADGDRWRISGVIDWEAAATGSPFVDVGSLFRHAPRYDDAFRIAFERGYREADGVLPDDWYLTARTLDAFRMIDTLAEDRELPGVFADCRMLLAKLVADEALPRREQHA
jgi:aminoglycoside phosphotransferase (APT) family kinase protein